MNVLRCRNKGPYVSEQRYSVEGWWGECVYTTINHNGLGKLVCEHMILCSHRVDGRGVLAQTSPQTQQPTAESGEGVFRRFIVELGGGNALQIHNNQLKIVVRLLDLQICLCY